MQDILTVSELSLSIKKHLESRFLSVVVKGEITNFKEQASGHLYFTLKDEGAQISAVLFRGNAAKLKKTPKGGDQVILKGELSLYMPRGQYQIIVKEIEHVGVGELLLRFHALKNKLEALGWFSQEHKKQLPKYPKTIGVVTSPTGAVIQDILHVLTRRFAGFHLILNPVKVQGEGSALEIAKAIDQFNTYGLADLLIVGRGGGSLEDLWAFNEECVAAAIFRSKIPVISAVGHESDFCIADCVADVRAPTPSAAAEIASTEKTAQLSFLKKTESQLFFHITARLKQEKTALLGIKREPVFAKASFLLNPYLQKLGSTESDLSHFMERSLETYRLRLLSIQKQLSTLNPLSQIALSKTKLKMEGRFDTRMHQILQEKKTRLLQLTSHLKGIDPKNLLTKGYCILFEEKKDSVILSAKGLEVGSSVSIRFHDGTARAHIDKVDL